jgi:VWFA-related protein
MTRKEEGKMDRNFSTKFVLTLSVLVLFLWPASNGCRGRTADPPLVQTSSAQINVTSRQIANGNVVLNTIADQTVLIQNTGSKNLNIGLIAQANPLASPFSIVSDDCSGRAVQPSAACRFKVQFSPTAQGTFSDNFDIPSDASNENSVTVGVTGSGKALRVAINQVKTNSCSTDGVLELIVTVTKNNAPLEGLAPANFQLKENGVPRDIDSVSAVLAPVSASVAALLDYTTSMQSQVSAIEDASRFFAGLLNADDETAIIKFAQRQQLMQDFTDNTALLITAIDTAPTSIGRQDETRLYDAIWFAIEKTAARQKSKAIVLISDGKDISYQGVPNVSVKTLAEVIAYAAENAVAIYAVGLGDVDAEVLNRLASETGGQYFYITNAEQLTGVYRAIRDLLADQYSVKYGPSSRGSGLIMLNIDVVVSADEGSATGQFAGCP